MSTTHDSPSPEQEQGQYIHSLCRTHIHQLNNSLAAILGYTGLLQETVSSEDRFTHEQLGKLKEATHEALQTLARLGEFERKLHQLLNPDLASSDTYDQVDEDALLTPTTPQEALLQWQGCEQILLVEDDPLLSSVVIEYLEHLGYSILLAKDGEEALALVKTEHNDIDIACIDYHLPGPNGLEIAQSLRRLHPRMRLLLISGMKLKQSPEIKALRFSQILMKPIELRDLARIIRETLDAPPPEENT